MFTFTKLILLVFIYFQNIEAAMSENLAIISWDHAVNDKSKLEAALKSDVQMLEADIQIGSLLNSSETNIPIMAHPPSKISDLSLEQFLQNVTDFNSQQKTEKKGIKLDFKSIEAFTASIPILVKQNISQVPFPVWLNADILKGPGNPSSVPVNSNEFLGSAKQFPNATLSIGWTTNYDNTTQNLTYTQENINSMFETLQKNTIKQKITFPVRAVFAATSPEQMTALVTNSSDSTLTIWSADSDPVDVEKLKKLIKEIGKEKIYVDVPKTLKDQLGLNGAMGRFAPVVGLCSVLSALLLLF